MAVLTNETWSGATAAWHELPRTLAAGSVTLIAALPLITALMYGAPGWLPALAVLPVLLALTGVAAFTAAVARGDQPSLAALRRVDPVLALLLSVAGLAFVAPWGVVPAAAVVIVGPYALAYGAVRGRSGRAAVRGGAILAAYRPSWALTLTGLSVIGAFAVAASAGVLALILAPLLLTIACRQTATLLTEIDKRQSTSPKLTTQEASAPEVTAQTTQARAAAPLTATRAAAPLTATRAAESRTATPTGGVR